MGKVTANPRIGGGIPTPFAATDPMVNRDFSHAETSLKAMPNALDNLNL